MNTELQQILDSALSLPDSDRAKIAASLIRSLDPATDDEVDAAWAEEVKRRVESTDRGDVTLIPWESVMQEMRERRND